MAKRKRKSLAGGIRKMISSESGGFNYLNMPKGVPLFKETVSKEEILIDHVPYIVKNVKKHPDSMLIPDDIWWRLPFKLHNRLGPDGKSKCICPGTIGKACPACERGREIYDDPALDDDDAKVFYASPRALYYIRIDGKIYLWNISYKCYGEQLKYEIDLNQDYEAFADIEDGYSLALRFKKEKLGKNGYIKINKIDFKERTDEYDESIFENLTDLADCITIPSYDDVKNIMEGHEVEESNEPIEEKKEKEKPKKKAAKKKAPKKKAKPKKLECPHDCEFGKDFDEYECCSESSCPIYLECEKAAGKDDSSNEEDPPFDTDEKTNKKSKCPHGHTFEKDWDEKDDCDNCDIWNECGDMD